MDLTGGGAFYSLTPRRNLADLGVNELRETPHIGKDIERYPSKGCSQAEGKSLLLERWCHEVTEDLDVNNTSAVIPCSTRNRKNKQSSALLRFFGLCHQNDHLKSPLPPFKKGGKITAFTLAEGATHVDTFHDIRKLAFTLAEVLVTLGIIGIVAAMTLPMLAKNYQFFIRQQQFKKAYAELSIAVQKAQIDLGEGVRCSYINAQWTPANLVECDWFYQELMKNLKVIKVCQNNSVQSGCISENMKMLDEINVDLFGVELTDAMKNGCGGAMREKIQNKVPVYIFNSGYSIFPYYIAQGEHHSMIFFLDVNALSAPNKWGHDIFAFRLNKKSKTDSVFKIEPQDGCFLPEKGGYYTTDFFDYLYGQNAEL